MGKHKEPPEPDADVAVPEDARLTADELAFLLRDPADQARKAERAVRANQARTERRQDDPAYAERLRIADRERQRRRRARAAIGRDEVPEAAPAALPDLSTEAAAERLSKHLDRSASPQAAQLRGRPDRIQGYAEAFTVYRTLAEDGARPTRGAMAAMLKSRFGRSLTPSQIQKLRDHIEGFAVAGGPWHAGRPAGRRPGDTVSHAPAPNRG
ncbi:hypothetical protein [Azospirillum doebereinerae]|uniref:hypothetical protein n=1 Tax=Azospirillum doebereinerae TaxID=92933 RepID=UPI00163BFDE6|nr:hypothetical protein [Azospirillum doebereinerae]MCG5242585.1 hypothetical protein [Azospirillum doebereinerae]